MWKKRDREREEEKCLTTLFLNGGGNRLWDWGISRHWSVTAWEASAVICLLLAMPVCVFPSLKPPSGCWVSFSHYLWQSRNQEDHRRKRMSARNTHTHAHIKVTPPAVPEIPFITRDLNLFTMPYMKGAQDLLFLFLQHQLPTHHLKKIK